MHCSVRRTSSTVPEEAGREGSFQLKKFIEKNKSNSSKDSSEVNSTGWQDLNRRCTVYLWTPEPDGQWKLVALPVRHVYHVNQLGSSTPSITAGISQSRNRATRNTFLVPKEDNLRKRNSRKKKKKKGKHKKKLSRETETGKTDSESVPECGASQTGDNNYIHNGAVKLASATKLADSFPENSGNENQSEGTSKRGFSCITEAGVSDSLLPNSRSDNFICEFGVGIQTTEKQGLPCEVISPNSCLQKPLLDLPSLDSDCENLNSDYGFTPSNEDQNEIDLFNPPDCVARKRFSGDTINDIVTSEIYNQKTDCSRQRCRLEMEKSVKKIVRGPRKSSASIISSVGKLHGPSGRETSHSVWQKVQNIEPCKHKHNFKNVETMPSQFDNESKEAFMHEKQINGVCSGLNSDSAINRRKNTKVSAKMKRKNNLGLKQEFNYNSRNSCQAVRHSSDLCLSFNMQQNESSAISKNMNGENSPGIESRSHSKAKFATSEIQTRRVESIKLRQPESSPAGLNEAEPLESGSASTSCMNDQNVESKSCHSVTSSSSANTPELLEKPSEIQFHTLVDHEEAKTDKKDSLAPSDLKTDSSSCSVWQKCVPVTNSGSNGSSLYGSMSTVKMDELTGESRAQENIIEEDLASDLCSSVCEADSSTLCNRVSFSNVNSSPLQSIVQVTNFGNQTLSIAKEISDSGSGFTPESGKQSILTFNNYPSKLLSAVINSHRAQVASEAIQLATGRPIAEFEKLLHSASPVICTSPTTVSCQTRVDNSLHASLCHHEVPNIVLSELWQWYKIHGIYGLEVKADCENSCRLGMDSMTFHAYFVPYLSAVQLFTKSKVRSGNGNSAACAMGKGEMDESSKIPNFSHLLSILVPQPRTEDSMVAPDDYACSVTDNVSVSPAYCGESDELEILFEYFESEQPQKRRPLYEMINELVRGGGSSQCRVHGDGTILHSASMSDLHPDSWYSVAWYPIYRIPEGVLRAAFLTYHSLGHLVHTQPASDSTCMDVSVVSPVVGLQTYNTQGECWFQPRHSADVLNSEPVRILKERLKTLEQTASLMARAVITKGNETTVNNHPDYEFFLSRQRYQKQN